MVHSMVHSNKLHIGAKVGNVVPHAPDKWSKESFKWIIWVYCSTASYVIGVYRKQKAL